MKQDENWVDNRYEKCPFILRVEGVIYSRIHKHTGLLVKQAKKEIKQLKLANDNIKIKSVKLDWLEEPMKYGRK